MIDIGSRIKEIREQKGITQKEVCEKAKCTIVSLSRYESGKRIPSFEYIEKIANALDVSISELCGEKPREMESTAVVTKISNLGNDERIVFCSYCKHLLINSDSLNYCEKCGSKLRKSMASGKIKFDSMI